MSDIGIILAQREEGFVDSIKFDIVSPGATKITVNSTTNPISGNFNHAYALPISGSINASFADWYDGKLHVGRAFEAVQALREIAKRARPVTIGTTRETIANCIIQVEDYQDEDAQGIENVVISYTKIEIDEIEQRASTIDETLRHSARIRRDARPPKKPSKPIPKEKENDASALAKLADGIAGKRVFGQ